MKKTISRILAAYLIASALFSAAFAAADPHQRGDMLRARCGLLCVGIDAGELLVYSPFNTFEDVYLLIIDTSTGRVCSDGLYGLFNRI